MWIVRLALRRPYTFIVMAIVIMILGALSIIRTPKDIFPNINIPVVTVLWGYTGLSADQMANRIAVVNQRSLTLTVNDIEHIESESLNGIAVIKIFFQPGANIASDEPGDGNVADTASAIPARYHPSVYYAVQRIYGAHSAIGTFRARTF